MARVTCHMSHSRGVVLPRSIVRRGISLLVNRRWIDRSTFANHQCRLFLHPNGIIPRLRIFTNAWSRCNNDPSVSISSFTFDDGTIVGSFFLKRTREENAQQAESHSTRSLLARTRRGVPQVVVVVASRAKVRLGTRFERTSKMAFLSRPFARADSDQWKRG